MKKVTVIPVVMRALGCISTCFGSYMEKVEVEIKLQVVQKKAVLGTVIIL